MSIFNKNGKGGGAKRIFIILMCFVGFIIVINNAPFTVVGSTERAVLKTFGKVDEKVLYPGIQFKIPGVQTVTKYDLTPNTIRVSIPLGEDGAVSLDKQTLGVKGNVNWKYDENEILKIATSYSSKERLADDVRNIIMTAIKNTLGKYNIDSIVKEQDVISAKSKELANLSLSAANIPAIITAFNLNNWDWSEDYDRMIKETVAMQQATQRAAAELAMIEQTAQKQIKEAEAAAIAKVKEAEGKKKAAQLEAEAVIEKAKGQNEANRLLAQNLNVELRIRELEIAKIEMERWDGRKVPNYLPLNPAGGIVTLPAAGKQ